VFGLERSKRAFATKLRQISITERSCSTLDQRELEERAFDPPDEVKWAFSKAGVTFRVLEVARRYPLARE
jgi:hypothetical protein